MTPFCLVSRTHEREETGQTLSPNVTLSRVGYGIQGPSLPQDETMPAPVQKCRGVWGKEGIFYSVRGWGESVLVGGKRGLRISTSEEGTCFCDQVVRSGVWRMGDLLNLESEGGGMRDGKGCFES